jgi:exonuclease SbcC
MKPIKVVMSAFGSYAGLVEVKFDKVNQGIFLITGDTGAGKTTIFDAITYALYDETSGGKRDGDMMRSEYALEDTPTYVELTFCYENQEYTIKRNPNYARLSKRKNKEGELTLTQEIAAVELIMPDGKPFYGKMKETNQKIIDIVGLDVNQFTQIAMIAQGEFMKLLHAPSRERKEIFARIFNTKIYYRIQKELNERAKNLYRGLEDNLKEIRFELGKVSLSSDSSYHEEWKQHGNFQESDPEAVLSILTLIREETIEKDKILRVELTKEKESLEFVKEQIAKGQELNQLFDALEETLQNQAKLFQKKEEILALQLKSQLARKAEKVRSKEVLYRNTNQRLIEKQSRLHELKLKLVQMEQELVQLQNKRSAASKEYDDKSPNLLSLITRLTDAIPSYEKLEVKRREVAAIKKEEVILSSELMKLTDLQTKDRQQLEAILTTQETLKTSETALITLTQQLKDLKVILDDLNNMQELVAQLTQLETQEQTAKEATKRALLQYQMKSQTYEQFNEAFILEQVGIIASKLEENEACPVCGSTSHPKKAQLSEQAVTQQTVEVAKKERDLADEEKNRQSEMLQEISNQVVSKKYMLTNLYLRIFSDELSDLKQCSLTIAKMQADTREEFTKKKAEYLEEEKRKKLYEANQELIKELTRSLENQETKLSSIRENLANIQMNLATVSREEALILEGLPYDSEALLQQNLSTHKHSLLALEQAKKVTEEDYTRLQESYQQSVGNHESEQKQVDLLTLELRELLADYQTAMTEQGFVSEDAYLEAKCENTRIESMEAEVKYFELETSKVEANLKIYQKQTVNKERMVLSDLMDKRQTLEDSLLAYEAKEKVYYLVLTNNQNIEANLKQQIAKRKLIRNEYERMSRLDRTANGKLSGMAGLDFQTYIQRRYFNQIIHEANRRLTIMTSNRFILQCRDFKDLGKQGEVGLDLDVYSLVTDKTRDVKTLSGGESFMAALAMALGMADVIQHTAGKIHLDTMFIDEGFGSLDDESRAQAIRILNELAGDNRLVGIISHVTELKEQIDRKLVVKKDQAGSRVSWVY